jgi:DNA-binding MurR/RpiR family transcriptional regulator
MIDQNFYKDGSIFEPPGNEGEILMTELLRFVSFYNQCLPGKSEHNICKAIFENLDQLGSLSLSELSERAFISVPTLKRFYRDMGFESFQAFKQSLLVDYYRFLTVSRMVREAASNTSNNISNQYERMVNDLEVIRTNLDSRIPEACMRRAFSAKNVVICTNMPFPTLQWMQAILQTRGIPVSQPLFAKEQSRDVSRAGEGSFLMLIGEAEQMDQTLLSPVKSAIQRGASVLLCVNNKTISLAKIATYDLSFAYCGVSNMMAFQFILDCLVTELCYLAFAGE